jgi:hypothetical protein
MRRRFLIVLALGLVLGADAPRRGGRRLEAPLAHPHDPVLQAEHVAMLDLISPADATHTAARDGIWSDPAIWKQGTAPAAQATVFIPKGKTVTLNGVLAAPLRAVRVDGTLQFAPDANTGLVVDTLVITPTGQLIVGTADRPIAPDKRAEIVFSGGGPIDFAWDPTLMSRGLISHGTVSVHGAPATAFVALARPARQGDTTLVLAQQPQNWKKGDRLLLTGTTLSLKPQEEKADERPVQKPGGFKKNQPLQAPTPSGKKAIPPGIKQAAGPVPAKAGAAQNRIEDKKPAAPALKRTGAPSQDEERTIQAISGTEVTIAPLDYDHAAPVPDLGVHVANLSRNVVFRSQDPSVLDRRGHTMFMHSPAVTLSHAGFYDLGRTDKRQLVNDPRLDDHNRLVAGTGSNPRGRYAVHFHRTGTDARTGPAHVRGCAVVNSPGWGFVNHSSYVEFEDNVAYNVDGAAFVTEAGDEIGTFRHNLAVRSAGSRTGDMARLALEDLGHGGVGFWLQGGGVAVEDNIAAGQADAGFQYMTLGLVQEGLGRASFSAANLSDREWARGYERVSIGEVPLRSFKGNIAYASRLGYAVRYHLSAGPVPKYGGPKNPGRSVLEGGAIWNTLYGVRVEYSQQIIFRGLRLVGDIQGKSSLCGVTSSSTVKHLRFEDMQVEGWDVGLDSGPAADHVIHGGYFNNRTNFLLPTPWARGRTVLFEGDIRFGTLPEKVMFGRKQYDIYLAAGPKELRPLLQGSVSDGRDPNVLFVPVVTLLNLPGYAGKQVYYLEQAADHVPFQASAAGSVPAALLGKTNREMWDRYGLALGGAVAPPDARPDPRIYGLVGNPVAYQRDLLANAVHSAQLRHHPVSWVDGHKNVVASKATNLEPGWNLITQTIDNARRSLLVFGGDARRPTKVINQAYEPAVKE